MENVTIPLSKRKLALLFAGAILFVIAGIYFLVQPRGFASPVTANKPFFFIVGVAAILFFGICAITILGKLLNTRPGLIINEQGIIDNSSGTSGGLIPWSEIAGVKQAKVQNQRFILLMVTDPEKRIAAEPGSFKKRMMKINYRIYHTPVCITANGLRKNFDEVYKLINKAFAEYKK